MRRMFALVVLLAACGGSESDDGEQGTDDLSSIDCVAFDSLTEGVHELCVPHDWPYDTAVFTTNIPCETPDDAAGKVRVAIFWRSDERLGLAGLQDYCEAPQRDCFGDIHADPPECCAGLPDGTSFPADCL